MEFCDQADIRSFNKERENMAKTVAIGIQNFEDIRKGNYFYVDKTSFIKEWWEAGDSVTLITRPRRFGKTLNMSMLEQFFSVDFLFGRMKNTILYREHIRLLVFRLQILRNEIMNLLVKRFVSYL